jgi:hypothetical protein
VRRLPATVLLVLAAAQAAGCGSSSQTKASPSAPASTAATTTSVQTTKPKTTTKAATTTAATTTQPAPTTTKTATTVAAPTATVATTSTTEVVQQSLCPSEQGPGILANFGHRRSPGAANQLVARAAVVGFHGLLVQRRGCHKYAAVLLELKSLRQARDLQREARSVGFRVQIECRSHPVVGGLAAVFGHRTTRRAAVRLRREAEHVGFQNLQVQQDRCNDWEVDLYGIKTPAQREELTKEAASVGFHLTFEPG